MIRLLSMLAPLLIGALVFSASPVMGAQYQSKSQPQTKSQSQPQSPAQSQGQAQTENNLSRQVQNTVEASRLVFENFQKSKGQNIPAGQLREAAGVVIIPSAFLAGVIPKGSQGTGVMLSRSGDQWSLPVIVSLTGGSAGYKIEEKGLDMIIIFKNEKDLQAIAQGKPLILGGEESAVAGGKEGANVQKADVIAYRSSEARPEFAGIMLMGSVLQVQDQPTMAYYQIDESTLRGYYQSEFSRGNADQGGKMQSSRSSIHQDVPFSAKALREALTRATSSPSSSQQKGQKQQ